MNFDQFLGFMERYLPAFLDGLSVTLGIAALAVPLALACGLALLAPRIFHLRALGACAAAYIELMRNTPLLIQMYLLYFGLPLLGVFWSSVTCGVIAIALQHGAFFAEIYRTGIDTISVRQWEAAQAIGMRRGMIVRKIILPQALLKVAPAIGNQAMVLVKDTSLVSAIGVMDLTLTGKVIIERSGASFEAFLAVAVFYLLLTSLLGGALRLTEARAARRFG